MGKMVQATFQIVTDNKVFCKLIIKPTPNKSVKMTQTNKEDQITWKMLKPLKEVPVNKTDFQAIAQTSIFKTMEPRWMLVLTVPLPQETKTISNSTAATKEDIQV